MSPAIRGRAFSSDCRLWTVLGDSMTLKKKLGDGSVVDVPVDLRKSFPIKLSILAQIRGYIDFTEKT